MEEKIESKKKETELVRKKGNTDRVSCGEEKVEENEREGCVWGQKEKKNVKVGQSKKKKRKTKKRVKT